MAIQRGEPYHKKIFPKSLGIAVHESLSLHCQSAKSAFFNVATNETLSYEALHKQSIILAINLQTLGYAGKIIGVCSENRTDFFVPVIAALYLGSPVLAINHSYTDREILHSVGLAKPALVFTSPATNSQLKRIKEHHGLVYLEDVVMLGDFQTFVEEQKIAAFRPVDVNTKEHVAALLLSSGTTGLPKAVMLTHHNLNALQPHFENPKHFLSSLNNCLHCLPFYHGYGFNVALGCIIHGITVKFIAKFNGTDFLSALEKYKIDFLTVVPPVMVFLAKHPSVDEYNLSSLKVIISAGAACSTKLEEAVSRRLRNIPRIHQGYGLTECTLAIITNPKRGRTKSGSVGIPDPGVEVKIRDPDTNKTLGANELGEICVRSELNMKGYFENEKATNEVITSDKWLLTGDLGYFDEDGYFFVVDRLKELIKFKGFQVPPAELEALLLTHPKILDAAVVGLPDEEAGELPLAMVVKKPGVELSEQDVKDFMKGLTSYAKQLHGGVRFVGEIPKNPSGKILRRVIRDSLKTAKL